MNKGATILVEIDFDAEFHFVFTIGLAFIIFEIYSKQESRKTDVWMHFIDNKNDFKHCGNNTLEALYQNPIMF